MFLTRLENNFETPSVRAVNAVTKLAGQFGLHHSQRHARGLPLNKGQSFINRIDNWHMPHIVQHRQL